MCFADDERRGSSGTQRQSTIDHIAGSRGKLSLQSHARCDTYTFSTEARVTVAYFLADELAGRCLTKSEVLGCARKT